MRSKAYPGEILELSRSCVHADYRNRAVLDMLWRGLGDYVAAHRLKSCSVAPVFRVLTRKKQPTR